MTMKTLLVTMLLAAAPGLAIAQCFGGKHESAMSCTEGMVYDAETRACVKVTG